MKLSGRLALAASGWSLLALALGLAPAPAAAADPPGTHVSMKDFAFSPATVTVSAGTAVTWTYDESATDPQPNCESPYFQPPSPEVCGGHSSTASDNGPDGRPLWDSGLHRAGGFPYSHVFTKPGTYHYYCVLHGGAHPNNPVTHMEGDVVVVSASSSSASPSPSPSPSASPSPTPGASPSPSPAAGPVGVAALPNTAAGAAGPGPLVASSLLVAALVLRRRR